MVRQSCRAPVVTASAYFFFPRFTLMTALGAGATFTAFGGDTTFFTCPGGGFARCAVLDQRDLSSGSFMRAKKAPKDRLGLRRVALRC